MGDVIHTKLTDVDKERALARYRSLRGRGGVMLGFVTLGPTVKAVDPEGLGVVGIAAADTRHQRGLQPEHERR